MGEATRFRLVTPPPGAGGGKGSGAIAMIALHGPPESALRALGVPSVPRVGSVRLVDLGGIDRGVLARFSETDAAIFPHAGPEVVRRVLDRLTGGGCVPITGEDHQANADAARMLYPEAASAIEARMLHALSRAASPLAIDLLLDQPRRWAGREGNSLGPVDARSRRLNRLIDPPLVAIIGRPNIGKSTLLNALAGRSVALVADQPGTTRDAVGVRLECAGLVVRYLDTPGLFGPGVEGEPHAGPLDLAAAELALHAARGADLLIAASDPRTAEVPLEALGLAPRADRPVLRVRLRADLASGEQAGTGVLEVCVQRGEGLAALTGAIREALVPAADLADPGPWRFW
jgi:hypothetical protein